MGIPGLTGFMESVYSDTEVFKDIELHSCDLIIDGYSLLYRMHSAHFRSSHGGNYDSLRQTFQNLFEKFSTCEIRPIVLLDGGRDILDRKFKTSLKRASDRLKEMAVLNEATKLESENAKKKSKRISIQKLIDSGQFRVFCNLLPILSSQLFIDLLDEFSIPHYQCFFEADYELACLGNELKCPVMSFDSDFLIFNLHHGYIPTNTLDTDVFERDGKHFMRARIYHVDNFVKHFNSTLDYSNTDIQLRKEMLAVFAVLCGNDYVESQAVFGSFLATFESANNNSRLRRTAKRRDTSFGRILDWLTQFATVDECVEVVVKQCKKEMAQNVREVISDSVKDYMLLRKSEILDHFGFIREREKARVENFHPFKIKSYSGVEISGEFLCSFFNCKYPRLFLDVLIHRRVIFNCQIEVAEWPSSFLSSINIRQLLYSRLLSQFEPPSSRDKITVKEHLRYQKDIRVYDLEVDINSCPNQLTSETIFKHLFGFNDESVEKIEMYLKPIRDDVKHLFCLLKFWKDLEYENSDLNEVKNDNYIRAFLVSFIKLSLIDRLDLTKTTSEGKSLREFEGEMSILKNGFDIDCIKCGEDDSKFLRELKTKLNNYCPKFSSCQTSMSNASSKKLDKLVNLKTVHFLSEFQAIWMSFNCLIKVFSQHEEWKILNVNEFFNATFLHNLIEDLEQRKNPENFINDLFGRKSLFKIIFDDLKQHFDLFDK